MRFQYLSTCVLACLLASCDGAPSGMDTTGSLGDAPRIVGAESCAIVGNYEVCSAAPIEGDGLTRFVYTVTHRGGPKMNYFFLQIPPELMQDLVSYAPSRAVKIGANADLPAYSGITWKPASNAEYAVTFRGSFGSGMATAIIRSGSKVARAEILGPSASQHFIAGSVYTDTDDPSRDQYRTREFPEMGIRGAVVSLFHADGTPVLDGESNPLKQMTDADGAFRFGGLTPADYEVRVEAEDGAVNALLLDSFGGESLYAFTHGTYTPGGAAFFPVASSQLSTDDVHMGFVPQAGPISAALDAPESPYAPTNELEFPRFLPLLYGLVSPAQITEGPYEPLTETAGTFEISFVGREARSTATIYRYVIQGSGAEFDASHLTIEQAPSCLPDDTDPEGVGGGETDPLTGLFGITYDLTDLGNGSLAITLAYRGVRTPGVVQFAIRANSDVFYVDMPGACLNGIASEAALRDGLDAVFYSGEIGDAFLILQDPLLNGGLDDLAAGIDLLSRPFSDDPAKTALFTVYARQLLLISELVFVLGDGPQNETLATTIHQYAEPIIGAARASKVGGASGPVASTGGMEDIPRMLMSSF